ncbi:hypothetical protein [Geobacter sp. DSM 9736]|uniref:hypothetical protein n=1 Tax=Geobacter sp. DSM 9736 TaxID=1277350 RepID=UPI000B5088F4|nr:hypothetical protein [Geobacter sp. DSM 9736]SNB45001.1 hypothetical protein SAMN06269301_0395 [Geobacter sp. DSM 9736]
MQRKASISILLLTLFLPGLCSFPSSVVAGTTGTTFYLDAAIIEFDAVATARTIDLLLPAGVKPGSLRLKPAGRQVIEMVEFLPMPRSKEREQEAARLSERRGHLSDRLKALEAREEIFRSAAKSQSGKAPRKTKGNPEPLATIRQGTEFAIAQLEEVYRARRKAETELKGVEAQLARLGGEAEKKGQRVRIRLSGKGGKIRGSYIRTDLAWTPRYDFRLSGNGNADVAVRATLPDFKDTGSWTVVPATISDSASTSFPVISPDRPVAAYLLPVEKEAYLPGARSHLSFTVTNTGQTGFPPGEATCYRQGEYVGTLSFPGLLPGESSTISAGR